MPLPSTNSRLRGSANAPPPSASTAGRPRSIHRTCCSRIRSEEHTSELQSLRHLVCRLLLEKRGEDFHTLLEEHDTLPRPATRAVIRRALVRGEAERCSGCRVQSPASARLSFCFFFNDTATTEIYTLSLHDALPILGLKFFDQRHRPILFRRVFQRIV